MYQITNSKIPESFENIKIALITDLHIGKYTQLQYISAVVGEIIEAQADIIIFAGDYVYEYKGNYEAIFQPFSKLNIPMYAVSGNHDHWEDYVGIMAAAEKAGVTLLENKLVELQRGIDIIQLAGVPDLWLPDFTDNEVQSQLNSDYFSILISHNPDYLVENAGTYDLGLAGHTHGGQLTFFGLWAPFLPIEHADKAWKGRNKLLTSEIIISNGIGTVEMPLRFFAPPEIIVVSLQSQ